MSATVTRWRRFVDDTDQLVVELTGIDSILPGATVSAKVIRNGVSVALPASVTDMANRVVTIALSTWLDTATPGIYSLRIKMDGTTWPDQGEAEIEVVANP